MSSGALTLSMAIKCKCSTLLFSIRLRKPTAAVSFFKRINLIESQKTQNIGSMLSSDKRFHINAFVGRLSQQESCLNGTNQRKST